MTDPRTESVNSPRPQGAIARWLAGHRAIVLTTIISISVFVRLVYFIELTNGPCAWFHRWEQTDMHFFHTWAGEVARGDWLTDQVLHPYHNWYQWIADEYFTQHPDELQVYGGSQGDRVAASRALWNRWYGSKRFHQEPLYPYLIALTYKGLGHDVRWVFAWQLCLGVLSVVLVYLITRRLFGDGVALVAALLAIGCGPLLLYDMVLLRTTLTVWMGLTLAYLMSVALERQSTGFWFLTGLGCGLALLLRVSFVPLVLGVMCGLVLKSRTHPPHLRRSALALTLGVTSCLAPAVIRNVIVGVAPFDLVSGGTIIFVSTNAKGDVPQHGWDMNMAHTPRIMAETGGRFLPAVVATLKTHENLHSYLRLLSSKLWWMWHWYEKPDNMNFYYYRLHSNILQWLPITFQIIAPLAIVGLVLAIRHRGRCAPLYLLVVNSMIPLIAFYTVSRLRVPLLAACIPFAALALVQMIEWIRNRRVIGMAIVGAGVFSMLFPLSLSRPLIRPADYIAPYLIYYDPLVRRAEQDGDWHRAAEVMQESLRYEPAVVRQMGQVRSPQDGEELQLAGYFATVHHRYARLLRRTGRMDTASQHERRAQELSQLGHSR